jgi:K+-sensing histidine kinase KdpD
MGGRKREIEKLRRTKRTTHYRVHNATAQLARQQLDQVILCSDPTDAPVSASRNGLGLGLHICAQIVRSHEGRISITSTGENGTQFIARLPRQAAYANDRAPAGGVLSHCIIRAI